MTPESIRITYGGDSGSSNDWELSYDWFNKGKPSDFMIVETGSVILLMVPQTRKYLC